MNHNEKRSEVAIDTIERLTLGGLTQWISLRSNNIRNPLLLFLHGGPGTAQISFSRQSQKPLEDSFLVVNWDQKGAGRSYSPSPQKEYMTIKRFFQEAVEFN